MHEFVEAYKFILHNGAIAGEPQLPSLAHLALETLKVGAIGVAISALFAVPVGVWLGHIHRGSFAAINLGNAFLKLDRPEEALGAYLRASAAAPRVARWGPRWRARRTPSRAPSVRAAGPARWTMCATARRCPTSARDF